MKLFKKIKESGFVKKYKLSIVGLILLIVIFALMHNGYSIKIQKNNESMVSQRYGHKSSLLCNGNVLIVGGFTQVNSEPTNTSEIYNYKSKTFSFGPKMNLNQEIYRAILLPDCDVLIIGNKGIETYDFNLNQFILWKDKLKNSYFISEYNTINFASYKNNVIASGGLDKINDKIYVSKKVYKLDTKKKELHRMPDLPIPLTGHSGYTDKNGKTILLFGSTQSSKSALKECNNSLLIFDDKKNSFKITKNKINLCTESAYIFPKSEGALIFSSVPYNYKYTPSDSIYFLYDKNEILKKVNKSNKKLLKYFNSVTYNGNYYIAFEQNKIFLFKDSNKYGQKIIKDNKINYFMSNYIALKDGNILYTGGIKNFLFFKVEKPSKDAYLIYIK